MRPSAKKLLVSVSFYGFILAFAAAFSIPFFSAAPRRSAALQTPSKAFHGNDGKETTSFGLHVLPHFIFSEDYHLYYLRAKRALRFGFPDDIFEPSASGKKDFRNLVQVGVTAVPALFGEKLGGYALIYFFYLAAGLWLAARASARFVRDPLSALLCAVLFALSAGPRYLRMSTNTLALPVLLYGIALAGGLIEKRRSGRPVMLGDMLGPALVMSLLSLWDVWSFLVLSAFTAGMFAVLVFSAAAPVRPDSRIEAALKAAGLFIFVFSVYALISGGTPKDLLERSGFLNEHFPGSGPRTASHLGVCAAAGALVLLAVRSPRHLAFRIFVVFAAASALLLASVIFVLRIEDYQLFHFDFLISRVMLWLTACGLLYPGQETLAGRWRKLPAPFRDRAARLAAPVNGEKALLGGKILILLVLVFLTARFFDIVFRAQYREFGNPAAYEKLEKYIVENIPEQRGRTLLTLSHEANHFLAYRTDFDLLLPEGFPLHSRRTNAEILARMREISALLSIDPLQWNIFLQPNHSVDQVSWRLSRLISERQGYLYYLFHRASLRPEFGTGQGQALLLKTRFLEAVAESAKGLGRSPDYILSEEVLRFLKGVLPSDYDPLYQDGNMTLYKRRGES